MKRKLTAFLAVLLILPSLLVSAWAVNGAGLPLIVDEADLLTAEEEASLETVAESLLEAYGVDIVILTVDSLDGKRPQDYADDYYDTQGYGVGEDYSGALFLLSMEERDLYVSTCGNAIYALTDYGIDQSTELALPYLSDGDYYGGFLAWLGALPEYFDALAEGTPIDGSDYSEGFYHGDQEEVVYYEEEVTPSVLLSLMIALPIAGVVLLIMRLMMNTKRPQHSATDYMKAGSFALRSQQDLFLYSQVTKREKPKDPPPSSSGGGSSVHTSSSGRSHGGGGKKF